MSRASRAPMSFAARLTVTLAVLLLAFGGALVGLEHRLAGEREAETLQRLSAGLARHVVQHWPVVAAKGVDAADSGARARLIEMLMTVNPGIQVYTLDADGRVQSYLGEPGMVRVFQVALEPVRRFLAGRALPLRGTDPMGGGQQRLFSAAMFPPGPDEARPPGYLYIVLDGAVRQQASAAVQGRGWGAMLAGLVGGAALFTLVIGAGLFTRQARAQQEALRAQRQRELAIAHREHMAQLAHDLRTPLTALHGQLEALPPGEPGRERALAQSERLRRLTQQLFELAALEATEEVPQRERIALDELVNDTVQKFGVRAQLEGPAPDRMEIDGDWQLIERALSNLIDNALRHAGAVRVSLHRDGAQARIRVHDDGPGLPEALAARLRDGASLRRPPLPRPAGGIGGLGLAIAQRVALLHGGRLLPEPGPGTRLALDFPLK